MSENCEVEDKEQSTGHSPKKDLEFIKACKHGDAVLVEKLLNEGQDVNAALDPATKKEFYFQWGVGLHEACCSRDLESVRTLLHHGADIEHETIHVYTSLYQRPIHVAANLEDASIISLLIKAGAQIHVSEGLGEAYFIPFLPIHIAASLGSYGVVKVLLDAGAKLARELVHALQPLKPGLARRYKTRQHLKARANEAPSQERYITRGEDGTNNSESIARMLAIPMIPYRAYEAEKDQRDWDAAERYDYTGIGRGGFDCRMRYPDFGLGGGYPPVISTDPNGS